MLCRFEKSQIIYRIQQIVLVRYSKIEHPVYPIYPFDQYKEGLYPFLKEIEKKLEVREINILKSFLEQYWHRFTVFKNIENKFTKENLLKLAIGFQKISALLFIGQRNDEYKLLKEVIHILQNKKICFELFEFDLRII